MFKRLLISTTVLAMAGPNLAGAEMTAVGDGEGALNIVAWPGYIENGSTDPNYDWVTQFEKDSGCKVNVKTAATSDEMVALMNAGGFDLVTAMEVIEHVADKPAFIAALANTLAPNGLMLLSCPNRTPKSRLLLVEGAERLGMVPESANNPEV